MHNRYTAECTFNPLGQVTDWASQQLNYYWFALEEVRCANPFRPPHRPPHSFLKQGGGGGEGLVPGTIIIIDTGIGIS